MPRRYLIPVKEMYARRALEWEFHFNNRRTVTETFPMYDPYRVIATLRREIPEPMIRADGSLIEGIATIRGRAIAAEHLNIDPMQKELMCLWYWSEDGWADYNRQYQNLPDVIEPYCLRYDEEGDAVLLVPASEKPKHGFIAYDPADLHGTNLVQVPYKSGTSRVQVP